MFRLAIFTRKGKLYKILDDLSKQEANDLYEYYKALGYSPQIHVYGALNWPDA